MNNPPRILISSTVYDKGELLDQIYSALTGIGYEVWISNKASFPIDPQKTAFENCLTAVENCDLFLGLISGYYGSGIDGTGNSITHQELSKAIALNKMRWFLVHQDVIIVRNFVKALKRFEKEHSTDVCSRIKFQKTDPISDIRVLNMYEEATRSDQDLATRTGNWVQQFKNSHDVLQFIRIQLGDPDKYRTTA